MAEVEPQDAAAEAFEALRAEVAQVRAALEQLGPVIENVKGPDYSPPLGAMAKTLENIEGHPALRYTPHLYGSEVRAATEGVRRSFEEDGHRALNVIWQASRDMSRFTGELRAREQQRTWLIRAGAGGLVVGAVLWALLSGPIARRLPASWHVPETMAAATLWMNRWDAGEHLQRTADPRAWNGVAIAYQLWRTNSEELEGCARAATKSGKAERCTVTLPPPRIAPSR